MEEAWAGRRSMRVEVDAKNGSAGRITAYMVDIVCVGVFITGSGDGERRNTFVTKKCPELDMRL